MSRKKLSQKRPIRPDSTYNSQLVSMFMNRILKKGKKSLAQRIFYQAMEKIQETTQQEPLSILQEAIQNVTPTVEVKSKRVGGSTFQVPRQVPEDRGTALALRWLLEAARSRSERGIISKLANEILDASNNTGNAFRKKQEIHRMAEANKAFAHYRF